ncbi:MAG TPA: Bax inhibitor-1 family protein [Planctomycetota bacterium]|nr:Bax inhibitor-1 family protein [Planctomycetota bacterium]
MRRFADSMAWADERGFAIDAALDSRMAFVRRTYAHLLAELVGVALVVMLALRTPALQSLGVALLRNPLVYIGAFFGVALVTRKMLEGHRSVGVQYAAAGIWVFFFGLLLTPLAMIAERATGSYAILGEGAILTGCVFTGLTAYVFFTKKDFSFLRGALWMVSWLLVGVAVVSWVFGWGFGAGGSIVYSGICVLLMGGWVLHDTSKVLHHRAVNQYVAASVDLLIDFVYMFIHIVLILLNSRK